MHAAGPGWLFLTGESEDIELLRRKPGFTDPDPELDKDKSSHIGTSDMTTKHSTCGLHAPVWPTRDGSPNRSPGWIGQRRAAEIQA